MSASENRFMEMVTLKQPAPKICHFWRQARVAASVNKKCSLSFIVGINQGG